MTETVLDAGDVVLQGSPNHAGDHLLVRDDRSDHATRTHVEPHGYPVGTKAKTDWMFDPYEDDGANYRIFNVVTTDDQGTTGANGTAQLSAKGVGDHWGVWPAIHIGFQDAGVTTTPLKLYLFDTADTAWRTPMIGAWRAARSVNSGDYALANYKLYQSSTTGTTGTTKPSHTSGTVNDGSVDWTFVRNFQTSGLIKPVVVIGDRDDMPKFGFPNHRLQLSASALLWNTKRLSLLNSTNSVEAWGLYCKTGGVDDLYIANPAETKFIRLGGTSNVFQTQGFSRLLGAVTEASLSTTPNVNGAEILAFNNSSPVAVTSFVGAGANQQLFVRSANGNTTLKNGASIVTNTGADKIVLLNQVLHFIFSSSGTVAVEVGPK